MSKDFENNEIENYLDPGGILDPTLPETPNKKTSGNFVTYTKIEDLIHHPLMDKKNTPNFLTLSDVLEYSFIKENCLNAETLKNSGMNGSFFIASNNPLYGFSDDEFVVDEAIKPIRHLKITYDEGVKGVIGYVAPIGSTLISGIYTFKNNSDNLYEYDTEVRYSATLVSGKSLTEKSSPLTDTVKLTNSKDIKLYTETNSVTLTLDYDSGVNYISLKVNSGNETQYGQEYDTSKTISLKIGDKVSGTVYLKNNYYEIAKSSNVSGTSINLTMDSDKTISVETQYKKYPAYVIRRSGVKSITVNNTTYNQSNAAINATVTIGSFSYNSKLNWTAEAEEGYTTTTSGTLTISDSGNNIGPTASVQQIAVTVYRNSGISKIVLTIDDTSTTTYDSSNLSTGGSTTRTYPYGTKISYYAVADSERYTVYNQTGMFEKLQNAILINPSAVENKYKLSIQLADENVLSLNVKYGINKDESKLGDNLIEPYDVINVQNTRDIYIIKNYYYQLDNVMCMPGYRCLTVLSTKQLTGDTTEILTTIKTGSGGEIAPPQTVTITLYGIDTNIETIYVGNSTKIYEHLIGIGLKPSGLTVINDNLGGNYVEITKYQDDDLNFLSLYSGQPVDLYIYSSRKQNGTLLPIQGAYKKLKYDGSVQRYKWSDLLST